MDDAPTLEERVQDDVIGAFSLAHSVHAKCSSSENRDHDISDCARGDDPIGENNQDDPIGEKTQIWIFLDLKKQFSLCIEALGRQNLLQLCFL